MPKQPNLSTDEKPPAVRTALIHCRVWLHQNGGTIRLFHVFAFLLVIGAGYFYQEKTIPYGYLTLILALSLVASIGYCGKGDDYSTRFCNVFASMENGRLAMHQAQVQLTHLLGKRARQALREALYKIQHYQQLGRTRAEMSDIIQENMCANIEVTQVLSHDTTTLTELLLHEAIYAALTYPYLVRDTPLPLALQCYILTRIPELTCIRPDVFSADAIKVYCPRLLAYFTLVDVTSTARAEKIPALRQWLATGEGNQELVVASLPDVLFT